MAWRRGSSKVVGEEGGRKITFSADAMEDIAMACDWHGPHSAARRACSTASCECKEPNPDENMHQIGAIHGLRCPPNQPNAIRVTELT